MAAAALALLACDDGGETVVDDLGDAPRCEALARGPVRSSAIEAAMIDAIADARAAGLDCGDGAGRRTPPPLAASPALRCAARGHARELAARGELGPDGAGGSTPALRAASAGYLGIPRFELRAADYTEVDATLAAWLASPEHCAALADRAATDVGVGHADDPDVPSAAWVVVLGEPRDP